MGSNDSAWLLLLWLLLVPEFVITFIKAEQPLAQALLAVPLAVKVVREDKDAVDGEEQPEHPGQGCCPFFCPCT